MNRGRGIKIYPNAKSICEQLLGNKATDAKEFDGEIDKWAGRVQ